MIADGPSKLATWRLPDRYSTLHFPSFSISHLSKAWYTVLHQVACDDNLRKVEGGRRLAQAYPGPLNQNLPSSATVTLTADGVLQDCSADEDPTKAWIPGIEMLIKRTSQGRKRPSPKSNYLAG